MPSRNVENHRSLAPKDFGPKLVARRAEYGFTRAQLAARAGVSRRTLQRIENGGSLSADTAMRLAQTLDLDDGEVSPDWTLPASMQENSYGSRVRALRRAKGKSLEEVAKSCGVSFATLSRFERDVSIPIGWIAEWRDETGRERDALVFKPLAAALDFDSVEKLHCFCRTWQFFIWLREDGPGFLRPLPEGGPWCRVAPHDAFPLPGELYEGGGRPLTNRRDKKPLVRRGAPPSV